MSILLFVRLHFRIKREIVCLFAKWRNIWYIYWKNSFAEVFKKLELDTDLEIILLRH